VFRLRSDLQSTDESALRKLAQVVSQLTCWHNESTADAPNFDLNFFQVFLPLRIFLFMLGIRCSLSAPSFFPFSSLILFSFVFFLFSHFSFLSFF
jgi:hypothetical protein